MFHHMSPALLPHDALLVVDVQPDFCPSGALPIADGDHVVPVINEWIDAALAAGIPIYASRDWHPAHHLSFQEQGGPWPAHCVQDTPGAAMHPDLHLPPSTFVITKGCRLDVDQYSAFDQTGAARHMLDRKVRRVWVAGLALDVCVRATVLDARQLGLEVNVILAGCRAVTPQGGDKARADMAAAGAVLVRDT